MVASVSQRVRRSAQDVDLRAGCIGPAIYTLHAFIRTLGRFRKGADVFLFFFCFCPVASAHDLEDDVVIAPTIVKIVASDGPNFF